MNLEPLSETVRYRVGHGNKIHAHKGRPEWGSVYARNEAMKDIFARCLKKTAVQVCTLITMHYCHVSTCIICLINFFIRLSASVNLASRETDS